MLQMYVYEHRNSHKKDERKIAGAVVVAAASDMAEYRSVHDRSTTTRNYDCTAVSAQKAARRAHTHTRTRATRVCFYCEYAMLTFI